MGSAHGTDAPLVVERLGLSWSFDPRSHIGQQIVQHGQWRPLTTRLLLAATKPGMHVLDVGAHFGWFTLLLARRVGPSGRVFAFEPVASYRRELQRNLAANGLQDRVTVLPFGLSDATRTQAIAIGDSGATLHWNGGEVPRGSEQIELRRLDDIAAEIGLDRIDLVRLDTGGHELRSLRGAERALRRWRPLLALAFAQHRLHADGSDVREQLRLLHELDYEACRESDCRPFESDVHFLHECGNFDRSANVLAVPAERLAGVAVRLHRDIDAFGRALQLSQRGVIDEADIDIPENECELFARKRRDAEVLCTLAASRPGPCLDLGTSFGRSAYKLARNVGPAQPVFTVNMLPEHGDAGTHVTHVLTRDQIGSYCRERGLANVVQFFADTRTWQPPAEIRDLALAFVDACHDTDAVRRDSHLAWQRLRRGGFLVWHDFSPVARLRHAWIDAVMRGVQLFLGDIGHREPVHHLRGSWIGVLPKN